MTRKLAFAIILVFAFSLAVWAQTPAPVPAASPAPADNVTFKVGIINIQGAILATNEGQREFQTLEKKFEPKRNELQKSNAEIEEATKKLQTQGDKLNDDARNALARDIENRRKQFQRTYEDAQADWNNQQNELVNRIGSKLLQVMDKFAGDNGYTVILNSAATGEGIPTVLWNSPGSDITKAVVDAYNAQNPTAPAASAPAKGPTAKPATSPAKPAATPAKK
jgi:outer membrane protein